MAFLLRRNFKALFRKFGLVGVITLLLILLFQIFQNTLTVVEPGSYIREQKSDLKEEQQSFSAKNDEPKFPEVVDDKKFVIKNLETNLRKKSVKVIEIENEEERVRSNKFRRRNLKDMGKVNVHTWNSLCSFTINTLRQFPLFPLRPAAKRKLDVTDELKSKLDGSWLAQRIMGFVHPPVSGSYQFELSSFFMAELWLSSSEDPAKSALISKVTRNKLYNVFFAIGENTPKSVPIKLTNGSSYYFEIIHVINDVKTKTDHVRLSWKMPTYNDFTSIKKDHVSSFIAHEDDLSRNETGYKLTRSRSLAIFGEDDMSNETQHGFTMAVFGSIMSPKINVSSFNRENVDHLPYWDRKDVKLAIYEAPYEPSYTRKRVYKRYEGVYNTHFTDVFPNDGTKLIKEGYNDPTERDGNKLIDEKEVFEVLKIFMAQMNRRFPGKYLLEGIINVERNNDSEKGNRYFLELVLRNTNKAKLYRIAEYVFKFETQPTKLFRPKGMVWNPDVTINVILTVKKQGNWGINFIEEMSRVQNQNNDRNLNFIIVDYGGDNVDMEEELKKSTIQNYTVIHRKGAFHKTSSINEAAKKIQDPNSIVFLMDLHLRMPKNIFDSIRKHTIQNLMSFTPVVFRLQFCGRPGTWNTYGSGWWETSGYGLFSIYKSDWDIFGGMNVKEFTNKWGGEDWEMVDRVLARGIEIERLRVPELYHFFHDKSKMWDKSGNR